MLYGIMGAVWNGIKCRVTQVISDVEACFALDLCWRGGNAGSFGGEAGTNDEVAAVDLDAIEGSVW